MPIDTQPRRAISQPVRTFAEHSAYEGDRAAASADYCPMCGRTDGAGDQPGEHDEGRRILAALRAACDGHPPDAAIIMWLCTSPRLPYADIAARLGISKMAVCLRVKEVAAQWPDLGAMLPTMQGAARKRHVRLTNKMAARFQRLAERLNAEQQPRREAT